MTIKYRERKLVLNLVGFYLFLLLGLTTPIVLAIYSFENLGTQYKLIIPALSVLMVSWFQKKAAGLLKATASFAIPGVRELRLKYWRHVNRLERFWLILAIWSLVFSSL